MTANPPTRKAKRTKPRLSGAAALSFALSAMAADSVEVFTDATLFRLGNAQGATVYDLSAPDRLSLGQGLPRDRQAAEALAKVRVSANGDAIRLSYLGLAKAVQYRIAKIPAILFNHGEAVVYGQTDVALAAELFKRWQAAH